MHMLVQPGHASRSSAFTTLSMKLRPLLGLALMVSLFPCGSAAASDSAPVIVPYDIQQVQSPVKVHAFHHAACRPKGLSYLEFVDSNDSGDVYFYVRFNTGGVHRQTLLCYDNYAYEPANPENIAIEFVPGKIAMDDVPLQEGGVELPGHCKGMFFPAVLMHIPTDGEIAVSYPDLILEVSNPAGPLEMTVRLNDGTNVISTQETLFNVTGFPRPPKGFVVHNFSFNDALAANKTYKVQVAFKSSWATPGVCSEFFTAGSFTTGKEPVVPPRRVPASPPPHGVL